MTTKTYLDHKNAVIQQSTRERGSDQLGADCAQGVTMGCLFDNGSDLPLKDRI